MTTYKHLCVALGFLASFGLKAQDIDLTPYLVLGAEAAEALTSEYTSPFTEGLMFGLAGGWSNTAETKGAWEIEVGLKTNGSVIPGESKNFELNTADFADLVIVDGGTSVDIPTIFGPSDSTVDLAILLDDETFEFSAPTGIGLADLNLLPNASIQAEMGVGWSTEAKVRFVPSFSIQDTKVSLFGFGIQHEFSNWIKGLRDGKLALSALVSYTNFSSEYEFETSGFITGVNQSVDVKMDVFLLDLIVSTKNPIYNFYGALGYVTGDADLRLLGEYNVTLFDETTQYIDPFNVDRKVDGVRLTIGGKIRLAKWSNINADYTFQGYNNVSIGLNFKVR